MRRLEQNWYRTGPANRALCLLLWPLSLVFAAIAATRRAAYAIGLCSTTRLPVPVIVVGNITAGGTGKTPLTIALARQLRLQNRRPGIICRGYGGNATTPQAVLADSDASIAGDEAVLMARRSDCPVWIGVDRVAAARGLLAANPDCDVLLSDDGLQHYALARDFEIAVIDTTRGLGNGMRLPAGPLREAASRLATVDAVVLNGSGPPPPASAKCYRMTLRGDRFRNLFAPQQEVSASYFSGRTVCAMAAIGNPQRFFEHLRALGIYAKAISFPDHHAYSAADLASVSDADLIMTGKDAVKCERFAGPRHWVLEVDAELDGNLVQHILGQLGKSR